MPEQSKGRRGSGGHSPAPRDGSAKLPWDDLPPLPLPDQSRYGAATTDPLGRDGPGWEISTQTLLPKIMDGWERDPQAAVSDDKKKPGLLRRKPEKKEAAW